MLGNRSPTRKQLMATITCHVSTTERIIRGTITLVIAAFAVGMWETSAVLAVITGAVALFTGFMTVTGFCTSSWFAQRAHNQHDEV